MYTKTLLRFAPSPTGLLHIGNIRIAMANYLHAQKLHGEFILRIDDTDTERSQKHFTDQIISDIDWLALHPERIVLQSQRTNIYEDYFLLLQKNGFIYECFETPEDLAHMREKQKLEKKPPIYNRAALSLSDQEKEVLRKKTSSHWRFKLSQTAVTWRDLIHGDITINTNSISDPVIRKPNGEFTYTFASSCDDFEMQISHIIRGDDHITNSAAQIEIWNALSTITNTHHDIQLAHMPLFSMSDGTALSKREMSSATIKLLREQWIMPLAICNTMTRIGTSMQQNIVTNMNYLIEEFDLSKISTGSVSFDMQSIEHANKNLITTFTCDQIQNLTGQTKYTSQFWDLIKDNISSITDIHTWYQILYEQDYMYTCSDIDYLSLMYTLSQQHKTYESWISSIKEATNKRGKELFHEIRLALTGQDTGPKLESIINFLGWEEVQTRLGRSLTRKQ